MPISDSLQGHAASFEAFLGAASVQVAASLELVAFECRLETTTISEVLCCFPQAAEQPLATSRQLTGREVGVRVGFESLLPLPA